MLNKKFVQEPGAGGGRNWGDFRREELLSRPENTAWWDTTFVRCPLLSDPRRSLGQMWECRRHPAGLTQESESVGQGQWKDDTREEVATRGWSDWYEAEMLKSRAGLKIWNNKMSQGTRDLNELNNQKPWRGKGKKETQGMGCFQKWCGFLRWILGCIKGLFGSSPVLLRAKYSKAGHDVAEESDLRI